MNLVMIYGPPAAGKLTVARELADIIDYKVFQNHAIVGCVSDVFPFDDGKLEPVLKRLTVKFRLEIYEEAAKNNVNLVTTYGGGSTKRFNFFRDAVRVVEKHGGKVIFIQLIPSKEALFERVLAESRKGEKIDSVDYLKEQLEKYPEFYQKFPDVEHLTIDNTSLSAEKVVKIILKKLNFK